MSTQTLIWIQWLIILVLLIRWALQRRTNSERLSQIIAKDKLTGDMTREAMIQFGNGLLNETRWRNGSFSVAAIDLDDFSRINEQFGADTGDQVLKEVARVMQKQKRRGDYLCRWRGEGWILLLMECLTEDADLIFQRLQKAFEKNNFSEAGDYPITISMGVAKLSETDDTFESLVYRSETALINAKQQGKNQLNIYSKQ